ncbi:MAG: hypothetical protein EOO07_20895, partial [Chitinophagaceae bacterium]
MNKLKTILSLITLTGCTVFVQTCTAQTFYKFFDRTLIKVKTCYEIQTRINNSQKITDTIAFEKFLPSGKVALKRTYGKNGVFSETSYTYGKNGLISEVFIKQVKGLADKKQYFYNSNNQLIKIAIFYYSMNVYEEMTAGKPDTIFQTFDKKGNLTLSKGLGDMESWNYDTKNRLIEKTSGPIGAKLPRKNIYVYKDDLLSEESNYAFRDKLYSKVYYFYDDNKQLIKQYDSTATRSITTSYEYDSAKNISKKYLHIVNNAKEVNEQEIRYFYNKKNKLANEAFFSDKQSPNLYQNFIKPEDDGRYLLQQIKDYDQYGNLSKHSYLVNNTPVHVIEYLMTGAGAAITFFFLGL